MGATKRMLVAGLMAGALLVAPMGLSVTTGGSGPGLSLVPAVPAAYAARVTAKSTGNAQQDDYCGKVADLINEAQDEAERQEGINVDEAIAWYDVAAQMMAEAQRNGCNFVWARAEVDSGGILGEDSPTFEVMPAGPGVATADPGGAPAAPITGPSGTTRPAGQRLPDTPKPVIEIAPADLQVGAVDVKARDGGPCVIRGIRNTVTATIKNGGGRSSGEFAVEVRVGDQQRGRRTVQAVASGTERTVEIRDVGMAQGERAIEVVVDPDNKVTEGDEKNNTKTVEVTCAAR